MLRDFSLQPLQILFAFASGLATQAFWLKRLGLQQKGFLSAVVTCCGLSLLLRSDTLWVHPLAAVLAVSSKFVLRINGKHIYNPANFGVVAAISLLPGTWISPGQWGSDLAFAVWFLMLGTIVTQRARRLDVSWVFLGAFLGLVALRVALLGQSWAIWWHQLGNGALLLFAFFMISDPMTIPNRMGARVAYAVIVALGAAAWQFLLFRPNGLLWALFLLTPLVPVLDRVLPGERFAWRARPNGLLAPPQGTQGRAATRLTLDPHALRARVPARCSGRYSSSCLRCLAYSCARCCCRLGGAGS
jgi:Na+-transporting NADH:ubiquinone oxidoreductase subunit NqrB